MQIFTEYRPRRIESSKDDLAVKINFLKSSIPLPGTNETILDTIRRTLRQYEVQVTELEKEANECEGKHLDCSRIYDQLEVNTIVLHIN